MEYLGHKSSKKERSLLVAELENGNAPSEDRIHKL